MDDQLETVMSWNALLNRVKCIDLNMVINNFALPNPQAHIVQGCNFGVGKQSEDLSQKQFFYAQIIVYKSLIICAYNVILFYIFVV